MLTSQKVHDTPAFEPESPKTEKENVSPFSKILIFQK